MRVSVAGLGKLGCSMAAAMASRGVEVTGYDVMPEVVDRVRSGRAPVAETRLQELLDEHGARVRATHSLSDAVHESDITFVVVPTPSDASGAFMLRHALDAFAALGAVLASKREHHTVVLTSTVLPGSVRYGLIPALEAGAGAAVGERIGVCYSPAFIALGTVIRDFLQPDFILLGESDTQAGDVLERAYRAIMPLEPPIMRMSLENAELTKIAVNTFVTTKISFANMLATLCERIPGGDVDVVSNALGLDRRIGRAYLTGALGYGGPCFPRDNQAMSYLARAVDATAPLADATDAVNRSLPDQIMARLGSRVRAGDTVGVLGLAYKPDTTVVEESQSIELVRALSETGAHVIAHDPLANESAAPVLPRAVRLVDDVREVLRAADVVLITTPDRVYSALRAEDFRRAGARPLVVDFWRSLRSELATCDHVEYLGAGLGNGDARLADRLRALWVDGAEAGRAFTT